MTGPGDPHEATDAGRIARGKIRVPRSRNVR